MHINNLMVVEVHHFNKMVVLCQCLHNLLINNNLMVFNKVKCQDNNKFNNNFKIKLISIKINNNKDNLIVNNNNHLNINK